MIDRREHPGTFDAIVIGAGFAGLYALYKLRQKGLRCLLYEAGNSVGGTWYWNRYPGARADSEAHVYQYWFSDELLNEWSWSERFPGQAETERYLNHVADRFDLRSDIRLGCRVEALTWQGSSQQWIVRTQNGEEARAQYVVACLGLLSEPLVPSIAGLESFAGEVYQTARWPTKEVDLRGKRVGVIGTGATGVQVVQTIAPDVAELHVFQRTPNYVLPMHNPRLDESDWKAMRTAYPNTKESVWTTFIGFDYDLQRAAWDSLSDTERNTVFEEMWGDGSLRFWVGNFREIFENEEKNKIASDFVRSKMRARLKDPALAERLMPEHGFGTRRVPLENGYLDAFNRPNVHLVDLRQTPIESITSSSVRTTTQEIPLDVLIYATGFDGATGALGRLDIRGRDGISLKDLWSRDIRTTLGMQMHGFPNLFATTAPLAPSAAFCNMPTCLQQQVNWISRCIDFAREKNAAYVEPTEALEAWWVDHHDEVAQATLIPKVKSWWMGTNVEGKPTRLLSYVGGVGTYHRICEDIAAGGYEGFQFGGTAVRCIEGVGRIRDDLELARPAEGVV